MKENRQHSAQTLHSAFTLIELLIVVAIISILASIAVPNFLDAQVRAKVSRIKNDMRALSVAVELYQVDNNTYLYRHGIPFGYDKTPRIPNRLDPNNSAIHLKIAQLSRLTTPVAYITLPVDIFDTHNPFPDNLIDYWDPIQTAWFINHNPLLGKEFSTYAPFKIRNPQDLGYLIVSVGPDGYLGAQTVYEEQWKTPATALSNSMYWGAYDPTNGTVSAGNIYTSNQMGGLDQTGKNLFNKCFPDALKADWPLQLK